MVSAGIDIGSRTVKVVILSGRDMIQTISETTFDPISVCISLLDGHRYDEITATGYGRYLFKEHFDCRIISEIKAFALGARATGESCHTILDIGGQDIKAISLDHDGKLRKFAMNDKCAAGTGRFLEIMAMALGCSVQEFGPLALSADQPAKLSSMCTVFAESEVISLLAKGTPRNEIALGIHKSITSRIKTLLRQVTAGEGLFFAGGVSLNDCMVKLIKEEIAGDVIVPDAPQMIGALGSAIYGLNGG